MRLVGAVSVLRALAAAPPTPTLHKVCPHTLEIWLQKRFAVEWAGGQHGGDTKAQGQADDSGGITREDPMQPWARPRHARFRALEGLSPLSGCSKGQLLPKDQEMTTTW